MARSIRVIVGAISLLATCFTGFVVYGRWRATQPLVHELSRLGGEYRQLRDSLGAVHTGVVHRIEAHCYSPGVGLVLDVSPGASPDSIFALATLLRSGLEHEARAGEDRYLTITLDAGQPQWWPQASRVTYTFAWTWSERQKRWVYFAFSAPRGGVPRALRSARNAAPTSGHLTAFAAGGGAMVRAEALALLASTARVYLIRRS